MNKTAFNHVMNKGSEKEEELNMKIKLNKTNTYQKLISTERNKERNQGDDDEIDESR